ncbi:response regulator [Reyranella sp.]|uniref:response regulator n=1 Tax=Reyranella sp. TaxID=1929291 RepID=UPI00272F87B5|nr:response regulator [Reyranella sp.]MDP2376427.1 response regulator [Reyranella sp.]
MIDTGRKQTGVVLKSRSILIVEDEHVTALNLMKILEDAGCKVIGPAATVAGAHACIADNRIDAALLDINLGKDTRIFPVAEVLAALRVPFAFVSGHPRSLMPPHLHGHAFIAKPFGSGQIIATVKELLSSDRC